MITPIDPSHYLQNEALAFRFDALFEGTYILQDIFNELTSQGYDPLHVLAGLGQCLRERGYKTPSLSVNSEGQGVLEWGKDPSNYLDLELNHTWMVVQSNDFNDELTQVDYIWNGAWKQLEGPANPELSQASEVMQEQITPLIAKWFTRPEAPVIVGYAVYPNQQIEKFDMREFFFGLPPEEQKKWIHAEGQQRMQLDCTRKLVEEGYISPQVYIFRVLLVNPSPLRIATLQAQLSGEMLESSTDKSFLATHKRRF